MSDTLSTNERKLFHELIKAAGTLATVADQASVVLSVEFEDMCRPQIDAVRNVLAQCPVVSSDWIDPSGALYDADIEETVYSMEKTGDGQDKDRHVKLVHLPSGIGMESYSKPTQAENREVARKALEKKVRAEYEKRLDRR